MNVLSLISLVVATSLPTFAMAQDSLRRPAPSLASLPAPAAAGPLRILLVDDDWSDNNHHAGDSRQSQSDRVFRQVVADAVGGNAKAWEIEYVKAYSSGPGIERLRPFSLIVWYTGATYGGNPDNSGVLSIEDEKTVRRYLEEVGGAVILFSPGYLSKVLGASGTWEKTDWKFLTEVLGLRGGHGLAQRFLPGTVTAPDGARFNVDKGSAVESQFSLVNPARATVLFSTVPAAAKPGSTAAPVATSHVYGKGRFIYVGFTFENLAAAEHAPAFGKLLAATGLQRTASPAVAAAPAATAPLAASVPEAEPATVQVSGSPAAAEVRWTQQTATVTNVALGGSGQTTTRVKPKPAATQDPTVKVERLVPNGAPVRLTVASPDAGRATDAGPFAPGRAVTYRVTLTDGQGRAGYKEASFTPQPKDPDSLSATPQADGSVVLVWPEVPGVLSYQVSGTALAAPVIVKKATEWRSPKAPGLQRWHVASLYEPGGVLTAATAWPSAMSRAAPTPGMLFLTLPSGPGSTATTEAYSRTYCPDLLAELSACSAAQFIRDASNWEQVWAERNEGPSTPVWSSVSFSDPLDLGVGRRVSCAPRKNGVTVCWATSHFNVAGQGGDYWPGFDSPKPSAAGAPVAPPMNTPVSLAGAASEFNHPRSLSIIVMSDTKAFFGAWKFDGPLRTTVQGHYQGGNWITSVGPWGTLDAEHIYATNAQLQTAAVLDTQGRKGVPHACLSCHGGTYNPATKLVTGASLLPLIPSRLTFPYPDGRRGAEERVRRINQIILQSNPAPAIVDQIQTMYGGAPNAAGAIANDAAMPSGWNQQAGLYRQVVAPYCASCHFAQRGPLNFRSWGNLLQHKNAVQRTVCSEFTMPHSEIQFRKFWAEGGSVSLPGMLSTALGFPKCPQ